MYKVTFFITKSPTEIEELIMPIGFKKIQGEFVWKSESSTFKIIPFSQQARGYEVYGYRAVFNTSIEGALYLLDMSIGMFKPIYKGIEFSLTINKTKQDWLRYFHTHQGFQTSDSRGIFIKDQVGVIVIGDNEVVLQIRPTNPKGNITLKSSLQEINSLLEEVNPLPYDLFTFTA